MELQEAMHAAGEEAPLCASGIDLDGIVRQVRRNAATRRGGWSAVAVAGVLVAVAATTAAVSPSAPQANVAGAAGAPPSAGIATTQPSPSVSTAPVLHLTAESFLNTSSGHGKNDMVVMIFRRDTALINKLGSNPCALPPGATAGKNLAPTPQDACTKLSDDGVTGWVRRWGYSPDARPWTTTDSREIDVFYPEGHGRWAVIGLTNTEPSGGKGKRPMVFDAQIAISDTEAARTVAYFAHHPIG